MNKPKCPVCGKATTCLHCEERKIAEQLAEKRRAAGRAGGAARAKKLTAKQRTNIASAGGKARAEQANA